MSEKDCSWHGNETDILRITYSILRILIPKSVLVIFTFAHTSFDDTDLIIARSNAYFTGFHFGPCLGKFVDIQYAYVNHFGAIMVYKFCELQIPEPFHFPAVLSAWFVLHGYMAWSKLSNDIEGS